jgi:hypothetical protein
MAGFAATTAVAAESAAEIVQRALDRDNHNSRLAREYTYREHAVTTDYDGGGRPGTTHSLTHDVLILYGRPYRRLIEEDGRALSADKQRKEEERLQKAMDRRRKAADEDGRERREYEKRRSAERKLLEQIPLAYDFRIAGRETIEGRGVFVIDAEPKPGYKPYDMRTGILPKMRGRLWIDATEYQWVKIEARVIDTISFGWVIARLGPGSSLNFEQRRVNDELWLPATARIELNGRFALFKKIRQGVELTYSNYKKFQADSRVVATGEDMDSLNKRKDQP